MKIVLLGDSITYGDNAKNDKNSWAGRLEEHLKNNFKGKFEIINSAVEGETAQEGLDRIETDVVDHNPDIVFVGYGTNDCTKEMGKYTNDFYNFESNMEDIAEIIRRNTNATVVFNLAPPVIEELCNDDVVTIHNRDIKAYNEVVKTLCGSMMMAYIDHYDIMVDKENLRSSLIDADGVHPTDEGHKVMFDSIISSCGHLFR